MNKTRLLITMLLSLSLLVACGASKEPTFTEVGICEQTVEDMNRLRLEFYANDDKIGAYKVMFGFNKNLFETDKDSEIEKTIEAQLGLAEAPNDKVWTGFEHLDGYVFVSVHFKDLANTSKEDFAAMGISDRPEAGDSLKEMIAEDNRGSEGIKCWIEDAK